jgi:hypothetical protein
MASHPPQREGLSVMLCVWYSRKGEYLKLYLERVAADKRLEITSCG